MNGNSPVISYITRKRSACSVESLAGIVLVMCGIFSSDSDLSGALGNTGLRFVSLVPSVIRSLLIGFGILGLFASAYGNFHERRLAIMAMFVMLVVLSFTIFFPSDGVVHYRSAMSLMTIALFLGKDYVNLGPFERAEADGHP